MIKKVVVIGGAGFMGSHTADALSERGYQVVIFDRTVSPYLRDDQQMVVGDILDREAVATVMEGVDCVYHYAGVADICDAKKRPFDTINLNVMGATIAMQAAVETGIKRFIYASTMYVYSPYRSFYRASKQAAETLIEAYHKKYDIDYTLLRYGSLYGPRSQIWNGLKSYISQVVNDGTLFYRGTGKERREYIHVKDAARLSVDVLDDIHRNQAITVTGSQVLNSKELIDMIFEIAGVEKSVEFFNKQISADHYIMTPYRYTPKQAKKLVSDEFTDLGQGILELVEEIYNERQDD